ncbi:MAG: T9SS type A sorting domain-containing protein [Saprospiraceae bacterium]|nr:T9SS type A sorting domain-containing protein [Saprospiraceae bacterium]
MITPINAQHLDGSVGIVQEGDQFMSDFIVRDRTVSILYQHLYKTRPDTIRLSFLNSTNISYSLFLESNFSAQSMVIDADLNHYIAGIYTDKLINDTTFIAIVKLDPSGNKIWTKQYEQTGQNLQLIYDGTNHIYLSDELNLFKNNLEGQTIWSKALPGRVRYYDQSLYSLEADSVFDVFIIGKFCKNLLLSKMDTSGNLQFKKVINASVSLDSAMFSTNPSFEILNDRIFISNSYWGRVDVDPSNAGFILENYMVNLPPFGVIFRPHNYLALYDLNGNLSFANSKLLMPKFERMAVDSEGFLYFTGRGFIELDFDLSASSQITTSIPNEQTTFWVRYTPDLEISWIRSLEMTVRHLQIDLNADGNDVLYLAGDSEKMFSSTGRDLVYVTYSNLGDVVPVRNPTPPIEHLLMNPNPSSGLIHFNTGSSGLTQFSLFDARLIYSQNLLGDEQTIDLSSLPNGIYLGRLYDDHQVKQAKIVISK